MKTEVTDNIKAEILQAYKIYLTYPPIKEKENIRTYILKRLEKIGMTSIEVLGVEL